MTRTNASPDRDLFLAALVDDAADGQRVLWVGDARSRGPAALAERAERVVVLDTREDAIFDDSDEGDDTRGELLIRPFADGPPSDPYDVAVVTELGVFRNLRQALERLERLVGDGLLVLVTDTHSGLEPEFVQDCVRDVFGAGRWFGQSGFVGDTVAELGAGDVQGAAVDAGLLTDTPPLARFIAVVGAERDRLPGYLVVQTAGLGAGVTAFADEDDRLSAREDDDEALGAPSDDDVEELAELREQLEASEDYAEEVERALAARDAALARAEDELDALREQLARLTATPEPTGEDGADAYGDLEERLREVGRRAAALEQEVERRGTLVRDAVEEAARLRRELARERTDAPSGAPLAGAVPAPMVAPVAVVERPSDAPTPLQHAKLAAELDAARFENDALRIALDSAANERAAALELVEAELLGRVRGLRARVAEVSELHESARALLALAEADAADAHERERRLQAEIGQLRERFEFELIRARSAEREPVALPDEVREHIATLERSEAHLSQRVSALSLQLAAARDLAEGAPFEGRLRALTGEVSGLRFRLDERERALAALRSAVPEVAAPPAPEVSAPAPTPVTGNAELEAELTARLHAANDTIDSMRTQLGLKDGLITRLQLELSDNEGVARTSESDAHRLRDENERLREALLAASAAVDERDALQREVEALSKSVVEPGRIYTLERARDEAKAAAEAALQELLAARAEVKKLAAASDASEALKAERDVLLGRVAQAIQARDEARLALRETHAILAGASFAGSQPRTTTAVGIEAPSDDDGLDGRLPSPGGSEAQEAVAAYLERLQTLESELSGQETLMRSLTAQLEERDDRIRALDRRLAGASPVASSDEESTKRAMLELEERAARLSEELHNERASRMAAQRRAEQLERSTEAAPDLTELNARLRARDAELDAAEARAKSAARDVQSLRAVVQEASLTLEGLLSSATASGDPATAQRLGELLTQLARF